MARTIGFSKINIVLIASVTIAPLRAKYISSSPTCELLAIIDPCTPGQKLAETLPVSHSSKPVAELLASPSKKPEMYIICAPSGLHVKFTTEVLSLAKQSKGSPSGKAAIDRFQVGRATTRIGQGERVHHRRWPPQAVSSFNHSHKEGHLGRETGQAHRRVRRLDLQEERRVLYCGTVKSVSGSWPGVRPDQFHT